MAEQVYNTLIITVLASHKQFSVIASTLHETVKEYVANVEFTEKTFQRLREKVLTKWENRNIQARGDTISIGDQISQLKQDAKDTAKKIKLLSSITAIKELESDIEETDQRIASLQQQEAKKDQEVISTQEIINSIRYFFEHFDELLLGGSDPLKNAAMFSLLFMKNPTYEELSFGTATLAPLFKLKRQPKISKSVSVNSTLVDSNTLFSFLERVYNTFHQYQVAIPTE